MRHWLVLQEEFVGLENWNNEHRILWNNKREFFSVRGYLLWLLTNFFLCKFHKLSMTENWIDCNWVISWKNSAFLDFIRRCIAILGFIRCGISRYSLISRTWPWGDILLCKLELWAATTKEEASGELKWGAIFERASQVYIAVYTQTSLAYATAGWLMYLLQAAVLFLLMCSIPCQCCCRIIFPSSFENIHLKILSVCYLFLHCLCS